MAPFTTTTALNVLSAFLLATMPQVNAQLVEWNLDLFSDANCAGNSDQVFIGSEGQGCTDFSVSPPTSFNFVNDGGGFRLTIFEGSGCTGVSQEFSNAGCETLLAGGTPAKSFEIVDIF